MPDQYDRTNDALRAALNLNGVFVTSHRQRVEGVGRRFVHTIRFQESSENGTTCGTYALDLSGNATYHAILKHSGGEVRAGKEFMEWLLTERLQEIDQPETGCLAVYFADGTWTHIGIVSGLARVRSQWGTFPIYDHETFEVPNTYGDSVRYFKRLEPRDSLSYFLEYANTVLSGGEIDAAIKAARE